MDLITDEEDIVLLAELSDALQVALRWYDDPMVVIQPKVPIVEKKNTPSLALDWFHQERSDILPMYSQRPLEVIQDTVPDDAQLSFLINKCWSNTLQVWSKPAPALWIGAHTRRIPASAHPSSKNYWKTKLT